ncbi:DUF1127 domain-containing protein [Amaricoccus solimangrovi]|uniref:DUF1127 domain-containing protein n=1 Tax=Amaricoccus solimangrovi TaxID=2589815 RepID=A0A501WYQ4_9RHOB|nr:DUF1127 domain-containing protein [Amaricoccus solimangrovi]TPE53780.1 DUF1127 domain-containing protein [Amaricoccus solimangrovi]
MAVYEITRQAAPLGSVATLRVVNLFERVYDAALRWRNARATESALARLTDAQLEDIGVNRRHIAAVAQDLARR